MYVAAYAPAEGESVAAANELGGGHTEVTDHLVAAALPGSARRRRRRLHRPGALPPAVRAGPPAHGRPRFMAATQRPGALAALVTPSGPPAWETIPSWYLVASQDRIIPPEAERAMAARADATTVEINSSHVAMMSHPARSPKLILRAAR